MLYYFKEVYKSFIKVKFSFILSLASTAIATLLALGTIALIVFSGKIENSVRDKITLNFFIKDSLSSEISEHLALQIRKAPFALNVKYISKSDAEKKFISETGENFKSLLDFNPLPASYEVRLKSEYLSSDSMSAIRQRMKNLEGVDEIVLQSGGIYNLIYLLNSVKGYIYISSVLIILLAFYIVFSANRSIIHLKGEQIETMKLVGADLMTIKMPVFLNGLIIGLISSVLALTLYFTAVAAVGYYFRFDGMGELYSFFVIPAILLTGPLLGLAGSYWACRKITLKINKF
jgi:cell division transport system permease protein